MWYRRARLASANLRLTLNPPSPLISQISGGLPPRSPAKNADIGRDLRARLVWRLMWAPGPVAGRARPPSATLAAVSRSFSTLAVASTCSLSLPFLLSLVLSPSPSSSPSSFPHFLLPHYLAPRAPLARYTRAGACETRPSRTFFDDKMAV